MKLTTLAWAESIEHHIQRHNVTKDEASEVVFSKHKLSLRGRDGVIQVLGQTAQGRYLKVIIRDHGNGTGFVITALDMKDSERKLFFKRRKGNSS